MNKVSKRSITYGAAVMAMVVYLLNGICSIAPDEQGVMLIFGKARNKILQPGIHYVPPSPVGNLIRVKVNEVKRVYIGKLGAWDGDEIRVQHPDEKEYLTGDVNIINITMIVQYKVLDPIKYLYTVNYVDHLIEYLTETELHQLVGSMTVDTVLTSGKSVIQIEIRNRLQKHMTDIKSGIMITSAQFREISPPYDVEDAFKDVWVSKQDEDKSVYKARGYENESEHQTRGETVKLIKAAETRSIETIKSAKGESEKFRMLETEYRKSPSLVKKRIYLEKMEKILSRVKKVISG